MFSMDYIVCLDVYRVKDIYLFISMENRGLELSFILSIFLEGISCGVIFNNVSVGMEMRGYLGG